MSEAGIGHAASALGCCPGGAHKSASIAGAFAATKTCNQVCVIDASELRAAAATRRPVRGLCIGDPGNSMAAVTMTFGGWLAEGW